MKLEELLAYVDCDADIVLFYNPWQFIDTDGDGGYYTESDFEDDDQDDLHMRADRMMAVLRKDLLNAEVTRFTPSPKVAHELHVYLKGDDGE